MTLMLMIGQITVLREGLEAVVFIGGVGLGLPATAFPIAVIAGLAAGCTCGFIIYKSVLALDSEENGGLPTSQGWQHRCHANLPDHLDVLLVPRRGRSLLAFCLVF
jgi:hypothetical protein